MPFLSKFRKNKKDAEKAEAPLEKLDDVEEEGLLISTDVAAQPAAEPARPSPEQPADEPEASDKAETPGIVPDDPMAEAAPAGARAMPASGDDPMAEAASAGERAPAAADGQAEPANHVDPMPADLGDQSTPAGDAAPADGAGGADPAVAGESEESGSSDTLDLFREAEVESESTGLTQYVEDISIEDLMKELRELRNMLSAPADADDTAEAA